MRIGAKGIFFLGFNMFTNTDPSKTFPSTDTEHCARSAPSATAVSLKVGKISALTPDLIFPLNAKDGGLLLF